MSGPALAQQLATRRAPETRSADALEALYDQRRDELNALILAKKPQ